MPSPPAAMSELSSLRKYGILREAAGGEYRCRQGCGGARGELGLRERQYYLSGLLGLRIDLWLWLRLRLGLKYLLLTRGLGLFTCPVELDIQT